jgi:ParB-like chromosome segregation protein Spo0J
LFRHLNIWYLNIDSNFEFRHSNLARISCDPMNTITLALSTLLPDPANARRHPQRNMDAIIASLKRFGQQKPVVIDANNIVRAGNGTLAAAKALGWKEIVCVRSELPVSELSAYAVADNRTGELAEWDPDALGAALEGLDASALNSLGFDDPKELAKVLDEPIETPEADDVTVPEQFEVVVTCRDEDHQQEVFDRLTRDGETCRLLTM